LFLGFHTKDISNETKNIIFTGTYPHIEVDVIFKTKSTDSGTSNIILITQDLHYTARSIIMNTVEGDSATRNIIFRGREFLAGGGIIVVPRHKNMRRKRKVL